MNIAHFGKNNQNKLILSRLSLIDDDEENEEDPDIEDYESDFDNDSAYTLVKNKNNL